MKLLAALVVVPVTAVLLTAGCSGSSDDEPAPDATTPADVSTSFDRDALDQQAEDQAAQTQEAQDDLAKKVTETADELKRRGTVVEIAIEDGRATPQGERVEVEAGKPVTLVVTSDADEEIHVHSDPEHTYQVRAGGSIEKTFRLDTPGQVAVEAHDLGVTIVQLVVRP